MLGSFGCYLTRADEMRSSESRPDGGSSAPRRREFGEIDADDGDSDNMSLFATLGPAQTIARPSFGLVVEEQEQDSSGIIEGWDADLDSEDSGELKAPPSTKLADPTSSTAAAAPPELEQGPAPSPDVVEGWDEDPAPPSAKVAAGEPPAAVVRDANPDNMSLLPTLYGAEPTITRPSFGLVVEQQKQDAPDIAEAWDVEPVPAAAPEADSPSVPEEPGVVQVTPNVTAGAPPAEVAQDADVPAPISRETVRERRLRQGKQLLEVYVEQSSNLVERTERYIIRLGAGRTWSRHELPGDVAVRVGQVRAAFENETGAAIKYGRQSSRRRTLRRYLVFELKLASLLYDSATDAKRAELLAHYSTSDELREWRTYVDDEWLVRFRRSDTLIKFLLAIGL